MSISNDHQRIAILKAMLSGRARIDFDASYPENSTTYKDLKCSEVINSLETKYNTKELMSIRKDAFFSVTQLSNEAPHNFFNRLMEAAAAAGITDEDTIYFKFKYALLPKIQEHCTKSRCPKLGRLPVHVSRLLGFFQAVFTSYSKL